jgi:hypothetical protein
MAISKRSGRLSNPLASRSVLAAGALPNLRRWLGDNEKKAASLP